LSFVEGVLFYVYMRFEYEHRSKVEIYYIFNASFYNSVTFHLVNPLESNTKRN